MVAPISSEDRDSFAVKLKVGLVALVAASGGLTALHGEASLPVVLGAVVVGGVAGAVLVVIVFPGSGVPTSGSSGRRGD